MLKGKVLNSFLETLNSAKIKPYSQEEKIEAERELRKVLREREDMINKDLLSQLINSIEAIKPSVQLIASKESLDKIRQSGFPLEDYKYYEMPHAESTIYVVPTQSKPIKVCFVEEYEKEF